jgi:hypothetical protein
MADWAALFGTKFCHLVDEAKVSSSTFSLCADFPSRVTLGYCLIFILSAGGLTWALNRFLRV